MEKLWKKLEQDAKGKTCDAVVKQLIDPKCIHRMYLGLETPLMRRLFIIEVPIRFNLIREFHIKTVGFDTYMKMFGDEPPNYISLILASNNMEFDDLFSSLIQDLVIYIRGLDSKRIVASALVERLIKWKKFHDKYGVEGLGQERQRGLYGELWFLREYIAQQNQIFAQVSAWTGPKKTPHDFQFFGCAVEIKTSVSKQHQKIHIASEMQLDDTNINALFLVHLSLEASISADESLNEIVENIRDMLRNRPSELSQFEDLLVEGGYIDMHIALYSQIKYSIRERNIFKIKEGFPRIIERDLLNGVGDVKYSIALSECRHFKVENHELLKFIRGDKFESTNESHTVC